MAIKTKKIQDLGDISLTKDGLEVSDVYLVASQAGITGKISSKELVKINETSAISICEKMVSELKAEMKIANDTKSIQEKIANNNIEITSLKNSVKSLSDKVDSKSVATCDCESKIEALEAKVAVFESFLKALQADGYLTLANIKRAAAEFCPLDESAK